MKKYKDVHVDCTLNTKNGKVHVDAILHVNQTLQSQNDTIPIFREGVKRNGN